MPGTKFLRKRPLYAPFRVARGLFFAFSDYNYICAKHCKWCQPSNEPHESICLLKERLSIGVLFQKEAGGNFHYRYQIESSRKQISLKTSYSKTAKQQAEKIFRL